MIKTLTTIVVLLGRKAARDLHASFGVRQFLGCRLCPRDWGAVRCGPPTRVGIIDRGVSDRSTDRLRPNDR